MSRPPVAVAVVPETSPEWLRDAVRAGGGVAVPADEAEAIVWFDPWHPEKLVSLIADSPRVRWVHLPFAGVDGYAHVLDEMRLWTCGKGMFSGPVAEHAMLLALAGLRDLPSRVRARKWTEPCGTSLYDQPVTIVGAGGITTELLRHLAVYRCEVTVVRRHPEPIPGVARTLGVDRLDEALPGALVVFLALSLTPETAGLIGAHELGLMDARAWLVNVARGGHVVTDDLVDALQRGVIAGAALDVTDPEPLPDGHPLWDMPNCIITPHTANSVAMARPAIEERVRTNVARFMAGEPLVGVIDVRAGY